MSNSIRSLLIRSQDIVSQLVEGELTEEQANALTQIDLKLPAAVDAAAELMERMEHEAEYWKAKAELYAVISKRCANVKERTKEAIKDGMAQLGISDLNGKDLRFKLSNSKPRLIISDDVLDPAYFTTRTVTEVDKKRIEEDLKMGVPVDGAVLQETKSLRIYMNRSDK